ncbi:MAG: HAD family hydrolase [Acidobacteriota bacterium]|nr:HAD family hydrolase [Acidobacteriota bacterium]
MTLAAVLFDLYGTLVEHGERPLSRRLPSALGVSRAAWMNLLRRGLLTTAFADEDAFVGTIARTLAPGRPDAVAICRGFLRTELDGMRLVPGTASLLNFLKRRGLKLGLVSNLASPFKEPVGRLGLEPLFDAFAFSCDEGCAKPDPEIYARAVARLDVEPGRALFVGDSVQNDVRAPAALGMRTAGVGAKGGDVTLSSVADLGLLDIQAPGFPPLLSPGDRVEVAGRRAVVVTVSPVADGEQGRYNLVYRIQARDGESPLVLYAKRFLLPETAHLEAFAYRLQALTGLPSCTAALHPGAEPLLLLTEAPGVKYEGPLTEDVARALGGHYAFAFLFSNGDIRPRNAFVSGGTVTLVDLEHCFFNLAIDTEGLERAERPETFDRMPKDELARRIKKRVLSRRATSRARRAFFADTPRHSPMDAAFQEGWVAFCSEQRGRARALTDVLLERIHTEPPLVIGTHGYRRAMAEIDVEDIRLRLALDPEAALDATW